MCALAVSCRLAVVPMAMQVHAPYAKLDSHLVDIQAALAAAAAGTPPAEAEASSDGASGLAGSTAAGSSEPRGQPAGAAAEGAEGAGAGAPAVDLYVVCRRGNDSQRAVARLREVAGGLEHAVDVVGGLEAWAAEVDPGFPTY